MKDIIENRSRLGLSAKLKLAGITVRENGVLWSALMGLYYATSSIAEATFQKAAALRTKSNLPGMNSKSANKFIWEHWNWDGRGDEWTPSSEWKASVVRTFVDPLFTNRSVVLEIGPGAGRWTEDLVEKCDRLMGIDISAACVRECERRFRNHPHATFAVGNGEDLHTLDSESIDGVWSFDVFVHINKPQFSSYVAEIARVLRPGGVGVLHHGSSAGTHGGWRSDVTTADVGDFLRSQGLIVERQLQNWDDNGRTFEAGLYQDTLTCFRKPSGGGRADHRPSESSPAANST